MSVARVFRNASLLVLAQALTTPISIVVNAIAARVLGAKDFGHLYQALTFSTFVFLFVEWGQPNVLMAKVATHRASAGELLGSGIAFRVCAAVVAGLVVPCICIVAGYDRDFIFILSVAMLGATFATVAAACQDVLRGFERTDFAAASYVGWQLLSAAVVVPTLLLGGGLYGFLIAQVSCAAAGAVFVLKMMPRMRVPHLSVRGDAVKELVRSGQPFLWFGLVLTLQPLIDAAMLSKLAAPEAMGWYAAARKLVGVLTYPASALILALYPTLCRLRAESMESFRTNAAEALYAVSVAVVPLALGCALFPGLGVAIFGQQSYGPAQDDLRVLAPYVFLVYFSMPIGSCLASSGRQNVWTLVQLGCVLVSLILDPPLIRWFQEHGGNGGLGVCVAAVISELLMVIGGLLFLPSGILAKVPRAKLGVVLLSGVVMAAVAAVSTALDEVLRAVLAVLAYCACLQVLGGFDFLQVRGFLQGLRGR